MMMGEVSMHRPKALLFFCLLTLAGCSINSPSGQSDPFDRTRPSECVPLPATPTDDRSSRTPTPNPATQMANPAVNSPLAVTVPPMPTPHYIDLSPLLRYEDKMVVRVYQCDGTWVEYVIDPTVFPTAVPLSHGDIIYSSAPPASLMGRRPPEPMTTTATH
jgi:hypothetical protein